MARQIPDTPAQIKTNIVYETPYGCVSIRTVNDDGPWMAEMRNGKNEIVKGMDGSAQAPLKAVQRIIHRLKDQDKVEQMFADAPAEHAEAFRQWVEQLDVSFDPWASIAPRK